MIGTVVDRVDPILVLSSTWGSRVLQNWMTFFWHRQKTLEHVKIALLYMAAKTEQAWDVYNKGYECLFGGTTTNAEQLIAAYENMLKMYGKHESE